MRKRAIALSHTLRASLLALFVFWLLPALPAYAQTTLSAEIVSWQVIGLDSNDPVGGTPEFFLVQAKITNTGGEPATNAAATLSLGALSPNPCAPADCISLVSPASDSLGTIAPGATVDAFWTVRVAKTAAAIGTSTPVTITASATNAPTVTATQADRIPAPCGIPDTPGGTLFVQRLISQARNDVLSYSVSSGVQLPDGSWEVTQGTTFTVNVVADTATAYDEISVPATVDPTGTITPLSVSFTYQLGTPSDDDIYTSNAGGTVNASYAFDASALGTVSLSQLIYDCSGNSFHYNSDYLVDSVTIHVVAPPPAITLTKSSVPSGLVDPGQSVTFTIAYRNTGGPATNFVIMDVVDPLLTEIVPGAGGTYDPGTRTITWNVGSVPARASGTVSFRAAVDDFAGGKTITNVATGTADRMAPVTSPPLRITARPTTPVTGAQAPLLAILGWAAIGFGDALSSRRLERLRLRRAQI